MAFQPLNTALVVTNEQSFFNFLTGQISPPQIWTYKTADAIATVTAADYFKGIGPNQFNIALNQLRIGDLVWASCSNGNTLLQVTALTPDVTLTQYEAVPAGSISNADVAADAAIAFSKLAVLPSAQILVGSAGGVATAVALTGDIAITNGGVSSIVAGVIVNADINAAAAIAFSKLAALTSGNIIVGSAGTVPTSVAMSGDATIVASGALSLIAAIPRTISVDVTAAQFNGAYAAPHLILAAPSAGTYYVVHGVQFEFDYGGAQFANGGVMGIQYDLTANGAGLLTHVGVAAAVVQGVAADFIVGAAGFNIEALVGGAASAIVAKGLYLSNKTAAFDTGTSDVRVHVTYSTVTTSL